MEFAFLLILSAAEIILFVMILYFFVRLRSSEELLLRLRNGQTELMERLQKNADFERELMQSFTERQQELAVLTQLMEERIAVLQNLVNEAETISRSPQFLRELIATGAKKGRSPEQLARSTGLSLDEVELILSQQL